MGPHKNSLRIFGEYKFVNNKACHPEHDVQVWGFNFHRLQIISGQYKNTSSATQFHSGMHHIGLLAPYFVCVALYSKLVRTSSENFFPQMTSLGVYLLNNTLGTKKIPLTLTNQVHLRKFVNNETCHPEQNVRVYWKVLA